MPEAPHFECGVSANSTTGAGSSAVPRKRLTHFMDSDRIRRTGHASRHARDDDDAIAVALRQVFCGDCVGHVSTLSQARDDSIWPKAYLPPTTSGMDDVLDQAFPGAIRPVS